MTTPQPVPIGHDTEGSPIFPVPTAPAGHPQPVGVLADGQLVWPLPPGHIPADQAQPIGYLASGRFVYLRAVPPPPPPVPMAPPVPAAPAPAAASPATPAPTAWGAPPAGSWAAQQRTGFSSQPAYAETASVTRPSVAPSWSQPARPAWKRKRVLVPAVALTLLAATALTGNSDPAPTDITNAGSEVTQASTAKAPVNGAASQKKALADRKAAADRQAAADRKAAADRAAGAAKEAAKNGPADQRALVKAVAVGRAGYEATDNELKQRQIQKQRDAAVRAAVRGLKVTDWVGEIRSIDTNGGGKGVLELSIGDDTKISTWNNAFSDYDDKTLIPMDSAMYDALVQLEEGDRIRFSGTFFRDDALGLKEQSLTLHGQMMTPNFVFRFSKISAVD